MKTIYLLLFFLFTFLACFGQDFYYSHQQFFIHKVANKVFNDSSSLDGVRPFILSKKKIYKSNEFNLIKITKHKGNWFKRKLLNEHFAHLDSSNFGFTIDPFLDLSFGKSYMNNSLGKNSIYKNRRGIVITGFITKYVAFSTSFIESQSFFSDYQFRLIKNQKTTFGQGLYKPSDPIKNQELDYSIINAYLSITPLKNINITISNNSPFIGYGYKNSILFSDNAYIIPSIKLTLTSNNHKLSYIKLNGTLINLIRGPVFTAQGLFTQKSLGTHLINWKPNKHFTFSIVESTIWQTEDSNGTLPFKYSQLNPLPLINTWITQNSKDYSLLGIQSRIGGKKWMFYNQLAISNTKNIEWGIQLGVRIHNLIKGLTIYAEWQNTKTNTLYEKEKKHFGQLLLLNNINEWSLVLNYNLKNWYFDINIDKIKGSPNYNLNNNIIFRINSSNNLNISLEHSFFGLSKSHSLSIGLKTGFYNNYNKL